MLPFGGRTRLTATALPWARDGLVRLVDNAFPGLWAGVMCRKPRIDEALSMADGRFGAALNLGAGWDTRVYRLPALARLPVWEVDQHRTGGLGREFPWSVERPVTQATMQCIPRLIIEGASECIAKPGS
jgi:hypothetical protein